MPAASSARFPYGIFRNDQSIQVCLEWNQGRSRPHRTRLLPGEGYLPCNIKHTPEQKEYKILQQLWLKMAEKINEEWRK